MNKDPEIIVSIHCITYNHEPYIRECLEGFVMQQTNFKFEAVVHDDASTDGTAAIISEFAEKYPDIIKPLYETENKYSKGGFALINCIMNAHMRGKYIAMCEGDDYWTDPHKLQKQVDFLEANPEFAGCGHEVMLKQQINNIKYFSQNKNVAKPGVHDLDSIMTAHTCHTSSFLYRNSVVMLSNIIRTDRIILIFIGMHGKMMVLDDCMSVYRNNNASSVTHNIYNKQNISANILYIKQKKQLLKIVDKKYKPIIYHMIANHYFMIAKIYKRQKNTLKMILALCRVLYYDWRLFIKITKR